VPLWRGWGARAACLRPDGAEFGHQRDALHGGDGADAGDGAQDGMGKGKRIRAWMSASITPEPGTFVVHEMTS